VLKNALNASAEAFEAGNAPPTPVPQQ
jgi:hypothetical protein